MSSLLTIWLFFAPQWNCFYMAFISWIFYCLVNFYFTIEESYGVTFYLPSSSFFFSIYFFRFGLLDNFLEYYWFPTGIGLSGYSFLRLSVIIFCLLRMFMSFLCLTSIFGIGGGFTMTFGIGAAFTTTLGAGAAFTMTLGAGGVLTTIFRGWGFTITLGA